MRLGNFNQFFYFSARSSIGLKIFRQNTYEPACNGWSKRSNKPQSRTTAFVLNGNHHLSLHYQQLS